MAQLTRLLAPMLIMISGCISAEEIQEGMRDNARIQLKWIYEDLKSGYYDPGMRGLDMDSLYRQAEQEIDRATTRQERFRILSNFLMPLDDSHTFYIGSTPVTLSDFGFSYRFYGETAFVAALTPWADSTARQLRPGDEIVRFNRQTLTRQNSYRVLVDFIGQHPIRPLELEVRSPNDTVVRSLTVHFDTLGIRKLGGPEYRKVYAAAIDSAKRALGHVTASIGDRVFYWKLPEFEEADLSLGKVARAAGKHETVILDMRGNPGGPVDRLEEVLGFFIEEPVEIGTLHTRWTKETFRSKPKRDRLKNKLIILTDSETGSAAEVFTRLLQIEKRATVIGDRTAGAVMASMAYRLASITVSDFVLPNGERLEKVGVVPDVAVIPSPQQLAFGADPVLAYALMTAGVRVTPAEAAMLLRAK